MHPVGVNVEMPGYVAKVLRRHRGFAALYTVCGGGNRRRASVAVVKVVNHIPAHVARKGNSQKHGKRGGGCVIKR